MFARFLANHGLIDPKSGRPIQRFCWCSDGPFDIRDFVVKQCFISKVSCLRRSTWINEKFDRSHCLVRCLCHCGSKGIFSTSGKLSQFGQLRLATQTPQSRCLLTFVDADSLSLTILLSAFGTFSHSIIEHTTAVASPRVASVSRPFAQRYWRQYSISHVTLPCWYSFSHCHFLPQDTRNIARVMTELARRGVRLEPKTSINPNRRWNWMGKSGVVLEHTL